MDEHKPNLTGSIESEVVENEKASLVASVEKTRVRKKSYLMDLRIHSPASLGYLGIKGIDTAPALVRLAKVKGLDVIALTDFYSGEFVDRVIEAARNTSLVVIPGVALRVVLRSCDDVILSCLFPEECGAQHVRELLSELKIPEHAVGNRKFVLESDFDQVLATIERHGAIAMPSRMDKTPHRMSAVPWLVDDYGFRAFDLAYADSAGFFRSRWPKLKFQLFSFSNANALAQVGSRMARVKMPTPGFAGIKHLVARTQAAAIA